MSSSDESDPQPESAGECVPSQGPNGNQGAPSSGAAQPIQMGDQYVLHSVISILKHDPDPDQEFLDHALAEALKVTGSQIGYIYHYSEERQEFELSTWSKDVMAQCNVMNPKTCYELDKTGIWGEAVRQRQPIVLNDFAVQHPLKRGLPKGHAPLRRYMTIPIFHGDAIVAVMGVANKPTEYTQDDIDHLYMLGDTAFEVLRRSRAENEYSAYRKSAERYINIAGVMIVALDRYGRIKFLNRKAMAVLGKTLEALRDRDWFECALPERDRESARAAFQHIMAGGVEPVEYHESHIINGDGEEVLIEWHNSPQVDESGDITGVVSSGDDITEKRLLEKRVAQAERMDAIGQLAGGVAHDFNNQLAGILGYADMLRSRLDNPELRRYAETILSAARRSSDLTKKLLAFSRQGQYQSVAIDVHGMIGEIVDILTHSIDKKIAVQQIFKANAPFTRGDPNQLQNALLNLAINAADAMPGGGELIFETSIRSLTEQDCGGFSFDFAPGTYLRICVTDNGCGISPEDKKHIFEPFFTTKEVGKGTGMGLAAVFGTVKQMGGAINLYSEVGHGTTFRLYLPLDEKSPQQVSTGQPVREAVKESLILVIDDEEVFRSLATDMLRSFGYRVHAEAVGADGVEYFRRLRSEIDLVILDMVMPGMNGPEVYHALTAIDPDVKVLLASGYSINGAARGLLADGALDFVEKPFGRGELSVRVAQALGTTDRPGPTPGA